MKKANQKEGFHHHLTGALIKHHGSLSHPSDQNRKDLAGFHKFWSSEEHQLPKNLKPIGTKKPVR